MDDCVKVTAHLLNINDFDRYNAVYREFFSKPYPARTTVQSGLWNGMLVEIDAIAVFGAGRQG
jgi:2-iminobutanoate/2-iminopropanoate deaminase